MINSYTYLSQMHYYSFADGPAWSSIVNFISRLNVPNSNAASRYFSLTRTLFTALSPIKSGPDTNVKAKLLSRCAYSHHHYHPIPHHRHHRLVKRCAANGRLSNVRRGEIGKKNRGGGKEKRLSARLSISANFPPGRIMVRLRFHLVSASCTGRVPTNIDKFTGVPHKCARPPRTARINFEELNARAKTYATRAKIEIFPRILVDPSIYSGMAKENSLVLYVNIEVKD